MTSGSSDKQSPMIGEVGDGPSWYDQVTHKEDKKGACKRKRMDNEQLAPDCPFPLGPKLLVDYTHPAGMGITDVRVCDHKAKSLWVGVWLHCIDMSLSWEKEALRTLVQSRHSRGPLLSSFLAPRTGNLCYEEVVSRILQENWEKHEEAKEKFRSSLNRSCHQQTRLS